MHFKTPPQDWEWLRLHWQEWITPAAIALLAILLVFIAIARRRRKKLTDEAWRRQPDKWARHVRILVLPIVLMWETQGVYTLASTDLHAPRGLAYVFCVIGSGLLIMFSLFAEGHHRRYGTFGPNGRAMRYAAAVMGFAVATAATSVPEFMARLAVPALAILGWRAALIPDEPPDASAPVKKKRSRWIWTPSVIGTKLGLLIADEDDIVHDNRELRIRLMEKHAAGEHDGMIQWTRNWHGRRLSRLAARVTDLTEVAEVQRRRSTAVHILALVRANENPPALVSTVDDDGRSTGSPRFADVLTRNAHSGGDSSNGAGRPDTGFDEDAQRVWEDRELPDRFAGEWHADDRESVSDRFSVSPGGRESATADGALADADAAFHRSVADVDRSLGRPVADVIPAQSTAADRSVADGHRPMADVTTGAPVADRPLTADSGAVADRSVDGWSESLRPMTPDRPADPVADRSEADAQRGPDQVLFSDATRTREQERADRAEARELYLQSKSAGRPLKGAELARIFHRSNPRWGTRRIEEADERDRTGALSEESGSFPIVDSPGDETDD